ncbi:polcalcin Jun o 2 [Panicum miliaceum]|uniref:Polcalcin Jun o 2 n=1 Tax=Panicum miliaceum TaxID=4540 RepID=A0A3L6RT65_PANMI|nr:polcalcin Jun o 2 [Panicum miliaceum]
MNGLCFCMSWPSSADVDRDGRLSVEELLLDVMNAGELGLGVVLQSALSALETAAGCALVGADELTRALGVVGTASAEDCAAIVGCPDGDGDSRCRGRAAQSGAAARRASAPQLARELTSQ